MKKEEFCIEIIIQQAIKELELGKDQEYELLIKELNAMELTIDQRRDLMELIMRESWDFAIKEAPYDGNIFDDTDMADEIMERRMQIVVQKMLELKKRFGLPIAKYDKEAKRAYIEYADGQRAYFD